MPALRLAAIGLIALLTAAIVAQGADTPLPAPDPELSFAHAVILGIVEGLTEYLPVSSTGHLILTQRALGIRQTTASDTYALCIQAGAILAVLGIFHPYVRRILRGCAGRDPEGLRLGVNLLAALVPAVVVGLTVLDLVVKELFGLWPIVAAWFAGGVCMLIIAVRHKPGDTEDGHSLFHISLKQALLIGVIQCLAVWPGTSRSLVTIVGGVLVGLHVQAAVVFSFLLGALTLGAATVHGIHAHGPAMIQDLGLAGILTGVCTAAVAAVMAVRWMLRYLRRHSLALFGYYRIAIALVVAALLLTGVMSDR